MSDDVTPRRRSILRAGLATGALFLPVPYAWVWAQSEGAMRLLRAPKLALVVGNSKYKTVPQLKNPANDAKAIAEKLKGTGFEVTMKLDTGREEMLEAIRAYLHEIEQKKHIGLFYFAGHGVQLAWRNYVLPVDAVMSKIEDVAKQGIDIAQLMDGLTRAANPMNVIILDACRDNPFGKDSRVEQKGLSQMDAPNRTLLAYATSPGNVASDGDGANGLYTEHLLREIQVPETKVEDVFKRVRLGVRRKSNGAQVPWESTSLEEDFWFLPPREIKAASDAEKERLFAEELALWERIQSSTIPGPLEDFLRRHPSGPFSELAQLQLDRVLAQQGEKRIVVASQAGNPYTQGTARADFGHKVGDEYEYARMDPFSGVAYKKETWVVSRVTADRVEYNNGKIATDLLGNMIRRGAQRWTPNQYLGADLQLGKRWQTHYAHMTSTGGKSHIELEFRVLARELITVPAGTFEAFRVEGRGTTSSGRTLERTFWRSPQIRSFIRWDTINRSRGSTGSSRVTATREELVAYKQL